MCAWPEAKRIESYDLHPDFIAAPMKFGPNVFTITKVHVYPFSYHALQTKFL